MAPPQAHYGTQQAEQMTCKSGGSPICVRSESTKEEGTTLCRSCRTSHPIVPLTRIDELIAMQDPEALGNDQADYTNGEAVMDRRSYLELWVKRNEDEQDLCAWLQIKFAKCIKTTDTLPDPDDKEARYSQFVILMKKARLARNEVLQETNPKMSVFETPCGRVDVANQVCDSCERAVRDYGSDRLKAMFKDDRKTVEISRAWMAGEESILWNGE